MALSVADIAENGPFSIFPKMDRHLTLIEGRGFVLLVHPVRCGWRASATALPFRASRRSTSSSSTARWLERYRSPRRDQRCGLSGLRRARGTATQVQSKVVLVVEGNLSIADPATLDETFRAGQGFVRGAGAISGHDAVGNTSH